MPSGMADPGSAWPSLTRWQVTWPVVVVALVGLVILVLVLRRGSRRQLAAWAGALVLALAVLSSDVQRTAMVSYRSHMIEHLVVLLVIAPLIAAGSRLRLSRSAGTLGLVAFTVAVPLYHLTHVGTWVMERSGGHAVELLSFAVIGTWFWLPIYGANRNLTDLQRLVVTFIALPVVATTGLVLWSSDSASLSAVGMDMASMTIGDLRSGGVVMIQWGSVMMLTHLVGLALAARHHRRRAFEPVGLRSARL